MITDIPALVARLREKLTEADADRAAELADAQVTGDRPDLWDDEVEIFTADLRDVLAAIEILTRSRDGWEADAKRYASDAEHYERLSKELRKTEDILTGDYRAAIARAEAAEAALRLALEYWGHRQQRYKNRHPVWVQAAHAALGGK